MPAGRPRKYKTVEELKKATEEYFKWCDDNPWYKNELVRGGDLAGNIIPVPTARPYTVIAMCHHLGISRETWNNYEKDVPEFLDIVTYVRDKIYNQKFEGAAVGAFNSNLIVRELGLRDDQNINLQVEKRILKDLT